MTILKPCPCGFTPTKLLVTTTSQGRKWASVTGDCCMHWGVDFNTSGLTEAEAQKIAVHVWNEAPRAGESNGL